jgi:hypothetical protein
VSTAGVYRVSRHTSSPPPPLVKLVEVKAVVLRRSGRCEADLREGLGACGYAPTGQVLHRNQVVRPASRDQAARTAMPG